MKKCKGCKVNDAVAGSNYCENCFPGTDIICGEVDFEKGNRNELPVSTGDSFGDKETIKGPK